MNESGESRVIIEDGKIKTIYSEEVINNGGYMSVEEFGRLLKESFSLMKAEMDKGNFDVEHDDDCYDFEEIRDSKEHQNQMTMTIRRCCSDVYFIIESSEKVTVYWGDGSKSTTDKFDNDNKYFWCSFAHNYSDMENERAITIRGKDIVCLEIRGNDLAAIDVSQNPELKALVCPANKLTALDVSKNIALTKLECSENKLSHIDVSANTMLTELICCMVGLEKLDVSKNTALEVLACGLNYLTELNVSANTALKELSCGYNQLTTLDVSQNTALISLECECNQLTDLDVSRLTALTELLCDHNKLIINN